MKLRYTDRSKDDVEMAFAWYERQRRGLGFEFLDCVEAALQNIIDYPEMKNRQKELLIITLKIKFHILKNFV